MFRGTVRTPTVLQMEATECGAASLGMVLGYFGKYVPLEQLRVACGISRDGSKANYILRAAREYGLVAKGFKREIEQLPSIKLPAILFWDFNHYVVLDEIRSNSYVINDPAFGRRILDKEQFQKSFSGIVLELSKGENFQVGGQKPSVWCAFQFSWFIAIWAILLGVIQLTRPAVLRSLVDDVMITRLPEYAFNLTLFVLVTAIFTLILVWLRGQWVTRFLTRSIVSSKELVWRIFRLPIDYFAARYVGDVTGRVESHFVIAQILSIQAPRLMLSFSVSLLFLIILFQIDYVLASACLSMIVSHIMLTRWVMQRSAIAVQKIDIERHQTMSAMVGGLYTIEAIKASGTESDFLQRISNLRVKASNAATSLVLEMAWVDALPAFWMTLTLMVVFSLGAWRVMHGDMTIGMLVSAEIMALFLLSPLSQLSQLTQQIAQLDFHQSKLDDVYHQEPDIAYPQANLPRGTVIVKDLSYAYDRFAVPTIENFHFDLKPGQRVALVGPTGCGKSTIAKLMCHIYRPLSGEVQTSGSIGYVEQDIYLLPGRVVDNLTLWDSSVPIDDVIRAAQDAQIHDVIMQRLGGYDGMIEEGGRNLSGGEVQRLEIARALVRNPPILVLDECMSALDPLTEQLIDQNIKQRGCTCVIVAHRLSTIRDSDEIIVLDKGRIVERGTHDVLMAKGGYYQRLSE